MIILKNMQIAYLSDKQLTSQAMQSTLLNSWNSTFSLKISIASSSISKPMTKPALRTAAPIDKAPDPQPKSATSFPSTSPY